MGQALFSASSLGVLKGEGEYLAKVVVEASLVKSHHMRDPTLLTKRKIDGRYEAVRMTVLDKSATRQANEGGFAHLLEVDEFCGLPDVRIG